MAKRRTSTSSVRARTVAVIAAVLVGVGVGAILSYDRLRPSPPPSPPPVVVTTPAPVPVAPSPAIVSIDVLTLDAAVHRAIGRIGSIQRSEAEERTAQDGSDHVRWLRRSIEVRLARPLKEVTPLLRGEVEGAGGQLFTDSPTGVEVGVIRHGMPFVTHEIHFVSEPPQARAVIIFDDAGGSLADLEPILALERPVTVSVLPGLRYSREVAARAHAAGLDVFLHLPVEPDDPNLHLGPGGVTTAMSDAEILATVRADLAWVPGAEGMNNHMGSRGTTDPRVMRAILEVAKERGLIFVDSMTSPRSIAAHTATEMKIPTTARDVFLDNENDPDAIRQQFRRLIALAKRRGTAVAIGHTQRMTALILHEMLPEFDREGVELVSVATVVH